MDITSVASGMHYEGMVLIKDIIDSSSPPQFAITDKNEFDNTNKEGIISLKFKNNIIDSPVTGLMVQWEFYDELSKKTITIMGSNTINLTKGENEIFKSPKLTIPDAKNNQKLLLRKGDISLAILMDGKDLVRINKCAKFDTSVSVYYKPSNTSNYKLLEKGKYTEQKVTIGDNIKFRLTYGKGFPSSDYHKYLIIFEDDLADPKVEKYEIKYEALPVAEVKYTNSSNKVITEKAGVIKFEQGNSEEEATWTAGLADKTFIWGKEETRSPDTYEWNIFLLMDKNKLSNNANFVKLSDKMDYINPFYDCLGSDKPGLKKPIKTDFSSEIIISRKKQNSPNQITFTSLIDFNNMILTSWFSPKSLFVYKEGNIFKEVTHFSTENTELLETQLKISKRYAQDDSNIGTLKNKEIYLFISINDMFGNANDCSGIIKDNDDIIPVKAIPSQKGQTTDYAETQDLSVTIGFLVRIIF